MTDDPVQPLGLTRRAFVETARSRGLSTQASISLHRAALAGATIEGAPTWLDHSLPSVTRHDRTGHELLGVETSVEKAALTAGDGLEFETVRIPLGTDREAQCVSSQVGCGMACRFCETARMGLLRNLSAAEIVGQLIVARAELGWQPRSVVFQGMGEAFDNFDQVAAALSVLTDQASLGMAQDRLTLCTAGHAEGIRRFARLPYRRVNLSLSLNAATDAQRAEIMPIQHRWPLAELQEALIACRPRRNWMLGIHWCLMPGINDSRADAAAVAEFCRPLGRVMVHLIPYNPGTHPLTHAPAEDEIERFVGWLREEGLPVRRRITKGRNMMAACGQLGNLELRRALRDRTDAARPDSTQATDPC